MALAVQVLGGFLAFAGLIGLWSGWDMLPTERGIAWTIASSALIAGGAVTGAVGCAISRLDALLVALAGPQVRTARPQIDKAPQPVASAPRLDLPPRVDPPVESLPAPVAVQAPAPVAPAVPVEPQPERPRFSLPSLKIGGAGAAGAATVAAATSALTRGKDEATRAVDAALADLKATATLKRPEPVDPPVEILRPVVDDLPPVAAEAPVPPEPPVYADVPMPQEDFAAPVIAAPVMNEAEPVDPAPAVPAVAKDDPLAAFEQELDRLIPLRPARGKKARKESVAEPETSAPLPAAEPVAATVAEPAAPEPEVPVGATKTEPKPEEPVIVDDATPAVLEEAHEAPQPLLPQAAHEAEPSAAAPSEPPRPEVVGAYESGGAKYTMYSDGSVVAEAEGQTLHFRSLEDLREFIDGGAKLA